MRSVSPKPKKSPSVTKTLTALLAEPSNRSCADCRSALVDPSHVFASFCPSETESKRRKKISIALHDFQLTHQALTPPDVKEDPSKFDIDPATLVNQKFGGHGVFICSKCAKAHKKLGKSVTIVHPVQVQSAWSAGQTDFMKESGGNARCSTIYEAYMPESWKKRRPNSSSNDADRILFCRAKYEALAFAMPPPGPLSASAWLSILDRNDTAKRYGTTQLKNIHSLTPTHATTPIAAKNSRGFVDELPNRLIDYFCVISCSMRPHPDFLRQDWSSIDSIEKLALWPQVSDCYPEKTTHDDMDFPVHLPTFVLPEGCRPRYAQKAPTFFTFVLTQGDGDRLYGGCLQIHDENVEVDVLLDKIRESNPKKELPAHLTNDEQNESEILFLPKCLVLLSHHPFFDLFREALLQLYRISLIEAPLPIERYIGNLTCEVPLPPQGKVKVEFGFTTDKVITIERPPINRLPLANFSYRPLFASLSVGNIMIVVGCLLEECKVVLLSQHYSLLCPAAEALLSALFPFEWQGLYVPVMPYSMIDILEAPVPYLVGLDSRYLQEVDPAKRPKSVVFVDLDRDVVYMGYDESTLRSRKIPKLPHRDASKLKSSLDTFGGPVYLIPNSGIKGCVMSGTARMLMITNEERPKYAHMRSAQLDAETLGRKDVFSRTEKAYDGHDLEDAIGGFRTVHGHMKDNDDDDSVSSSESGTRVFPRMRKPKFMRGKKKPSILSNSSNARSQAHLLDTGEPAGFSSSEIRGAFLRFIVSLFVNYERCVLPHRGNENFNEEKFLEDFRNSDPDCVGFMYRVLKTQMFQHFIEERVENAGDPTIRFFDESILAKHNRSKKTTLTNGGKKATPFLDNEAWKITKAYTPPPPSNQGLSDNDSSYHYGTFPSLDYSRFGKIRAPMTWPQEHSLRDSLRTRTGKIAKVRSTQQEMVRKAMKPFMSAHGALTAAAMRSARDLETALAALSPTLSKRDLSSRSKNPDLDNTGRSFQSISSTDSGLPDNRTVNTLSKADTIILNARRKQAILLDLVIELQAMTRMFCARLKYRRLRRAVVLLQRKSREEPVGDEPLELKRAVRRATRLQNILRRFLAKLELNRKREGVQTLQRCLRGMVVRRRLYCMENAACVIQKNVRARRTQFIYQSLKLIIARVQARVRGVIVRKQVGEVLKNRMTLYRKHIFELWHAACISLAVRTKLWPTYQTGRSFARLRLAESEVQRLWKLLKMKAPRPISSGPIDKTGRTAIVLGMDNSVYAKCKSMNATLSNGNQKGGVSSSNTGRVQYERLQIYERLNSKAFAEVPSKLYSEFSIPFHEKMKKVCLANLMWTAYGQVDVSVKVMMIIFPELEGSMNISFHPPSKKAKRRFSEAPETAPTPIDKELWERSSLEGTIKKHVKEVTSIYITQVPSLMVRLSEAEKRRDAKWKSLQAAVIAAHKPDSWVVSRRRMIIQYLQVRYAAPEKVTRPRKRKNKQKVAPEAAVPAKEKAGDDYAHTSSNPFEVKNTSINHHHHHDMEPERFPDIPLTSSGMSQVAAGGVDFPDISSGVAGGVVFADIETETKPDGFDFPDISMMGQTNGGGGGGVEPMAAAAASFPDIKMGLSSDSC